MGPHECLDELANLLAPDHAVQSLVNLFIYVCKAVSSRRDPDTPVATVWP